jgi:hypothetical protein
MLSLFCSARDKIGLGFCFASLNERIFFAHFEEEPKGRPESRSFGPDESAAKLAFGAAERFDFAFAAMDRDVVFCLSSSFGDDPGVASRAVVTNDFRDGVIRAFGAFIHDADDGVRAVGALVR